MPAHPGSEKRQAHRVPTAVRVRSSAAGDLLELTAVNLSVGGAYCGSPRPIEPMTRLDVILDLPGQGKLSIPVAAQAVVVRLERCAADADGLPYRLALWFQHLDDADRARLRRFLGQDGN
jgi:PilZ domain-containing protein